MLRIGGRVKNLEEKKSENTVQYTSICTHKIPLTLLYMCIYSHTQRGNLYICIAGWTNCSAVNFPEDKYIAKLIGA